MSRVGAERKVLMICLDAAEVSLVRRMADEGELPHIAALMKRGASGRLSSPADWFGGSIWATFFTGTSPAEHGFHHYLQWRPDTMTTIRPAPDWLPLHPFWRDVGRCGKRVVALDVPLVYAPGKPFDGYEISGWANHDLLEPLYYFPRSLEGWVRDRFGESPRQPEDHFLTSAPKLIAMRDSLLAMTPRITDLGIGLMKRSDWDLALVCFSTTHRIGHKLWSLSGAAGDPAGDERRELERAVRDVYAAADQAVGRLCEAAGEDAAVMVFALHGMMENTCRTDILPDMLEKVLAGEPGEPAQVRERGALDKLRSALPMGLRNRIKSMLPGSFQDALTSYWRTGGIDWKTTRAFPLVSDPQGCIRINLKGREAKGIVEPGEEYDTLCRSIREGLKTFVDVQSGEPVAAEIVRVDELYPSGARRGLLPDIIVRWSDRPAAAQSEITSSRFGTVHWPIPGRNQSGRSGNHAVDGFLIATGDGIGAGQPLMKDAHIVDLAPTVYSLLGLPVPEGMKGRALFQDRPDIQ